MGETLPADPPKYTETEQSRKTRFIQCKTWRRYVAGLRTKPDDVLSVTMDSASSRLSGSDDADEAGGTKERSGSSQMGVEERKKANLSTAQVSFGET